MYVIIIIVIFISCKIGAMPYTQGKFYPIVLLELNLVMRNILLFCKISNGDNHVLPLD